MAKKLRSGRRIKKNLIPAVIILVGGWLCILLNLCGVFSNTYAGPKFTCFITEPGNCSSEVSLTASRVTVLDFQDARPMESEFEENYYYLNRTVQVKDTYTLQNRTSTSVSFDMIYPVFEYDSDHDDVTITVDGIPLENWWSMCSFVAIDAGDYDQTVVNRLHDGTNFAMAFPNWPELGEPRSQLKYMDGIDEITGSKISYAFAYYLQTVTIPAGGSAVICATYQLYDAGTILFPACYEAIPCESHTLIMENTGCVELEDENLGISDLSGTVQLELDPTRTDYFMGFEVKAP